jgi:hypothetical protein
VERLLGISDIHEDGTPAQDSVMVFGDSLDGGTNAWALGKLSGQRDFTLLWFSGEEDAWYTAFSAQSNGTLTFTLPVVGKDAVGTNQYPTKAQVDAGTNVVQASINSLSNSFSGTSRFPFLDTTSGSNNISLANGLCPTVNTNDYTRYIWQILTPTSNVTYYPPTGAVELAISLRLDVCPGTNTAVVATNGFCPVYACTNPAVTLYPSATNRLLLEKPYGATSWIMWQMPKVP